MTQKNFNVLKSKYIFSYPVISRHIPSKATIKDKAIYLFSGAAMLVLFLFFSPGDSRPPWPSWKCQNREQTMEGVKRENNLKNTSPYRVPPGGLGLLEPSEQDGFEGDHVVVGQCQGLKPGREGRAAWGFGMGDGDGDSGCTCRWMMRIG